MKNIPFEMLAECLAGSPRPKELITLIQLSRAEVGLSSGSASFRSYVGDMKATKTTIGKWMRARGYITMSSETGSIALLPHPTENYIVAYVNYTTIDFTVAVKAYGDFEEITAVREWTKATFETTGSLIETATGVDERGRLRFDTKFLANEGLELAHQSFYPWLSIPLAEYFDAFWASPESIIVMYGEPGTGKSTFLRSLIAHKNRRALLTYNKQAVESPELINYFYRSEGELLAYEDIDNYLGSREDGNTLMSSILNASEGVVKHKNKKIAFSTNLPSVDRIDSALLREGRCFDILHFGRLNSDEARAVVSDMQYPERDFSSKDKWSLAEVLSKKDPAQQTINRFGKRTGFI